jgi:mRNA-degrading endonuclease RelE of RelBE toxin-antitoxin system
MKKGKNPPHTPAPPPTQSEKPLAARLFELRYTEDAAADIKKLDGSVKQHLRKVLEKKLAVDPESYGLPLCSPLAGYWKHEFATHRIVYRIYKEHRIIAVCAVGPRKQGDAEDIYNQLNAVAETGRLAGQVAAALKKLLPGKK